MIRIAVCCALAAMCASKAGAARGQEPEPSTKELIEELRKLSERVETLEKTHSDDQEKIRALKERLDKIESTEKAGEPPTGEGAAPKSSEDELDAIITGQTAAAAPSQAKPAGGGLLGLQGAVQSLNPDISLNVDFNTEYSSREGVDRNDGFFLREVELGFSGAIDPYTRADIITTIGRDGNEYKADLEEGYLTFLQLPYGLQARMGQFRAEFGRANPIHLHALPWMNYPLVIQRYFGEEGLKGAGGELSWLVPNPWDKYISLTYEVFNNDNDTLFAGSESDDFVHLIRLKSFRDLSPASNIEFGTSVATAPNDGGHGDNRATIEGFDVTYHWKPKYTGSYRSLLWQTEVMMAQSDELFGRQNTWGMYTAADYQFAKRWKFGLRYDFAELPQRAASRENGYSAYLTFLQSEFVFWRLGYMFTDRTFPVDGDYDEHQLQLQLNYTLGAHPAHKF